MTLTISTFNIWAVLVAIILNMVLGMLWYSPLMFGNLWLKLIGKTAEEISKEESSQAMKWAFVPAVVSSLSLALILGFLNAQSALDGIIIATVVAVGFIGMSHLNLVLFESRSLKLTILNTGYSLASLILAGIVLSLWR